jgi:ubiquinol-cytochrome c reductase cytochrome b subunit
MTQRSNPAPATPEVPIDAEPSTSEPPPQRNGLRRRALEAIDERLGIDAIRYPVPAHANSTAYSLGGLTAVALLILIGTGIILGQFYNPDPAAANESVRHIVNGVFLGRFIRGVHFWASEAMYVLAILHLLRIYFTAAYKRPREANWLIGVGMFALIIGAMFTGTVLKWDQEGFEALGHNLEISRLLGGLGFWFNSDFSSNVPLLVRLYIAHISIIPMLIIGLLVLHALLVKRHKISPAPRNPEATGEPVGPFTHHLRRIGTLGLILAGGLGVLAVVFPPGVGPTPVEGIEVTKPPWMYWWMFTLENWVGLSGIVWGAAALFALLVAVPFIDRSPRRYWKDRPIAIGIGALVVAFLILLTILEAFTTPVAHLGGGM